MKKVVMMVLGIMVMGTPLSWSQAAKSKTQAPAPSPAPAAVATPAPTPPPAPAAPPPPPPAALNSTTNGPRAGTMAINLATGSNWDKATPTVGFEYYLDARWDLEAQVVFSLYGDSTKNNLATSVDALTNTAPQIGAMVFLLNETRLTPTSSLAWGPVAGLAYSGTEQAGGGGSKTQTSAFDLRLGGAINLKFFPFPGVAFFFQPSLVMDWMPAGSKTVTNTAGTKTTDNSLSSLSLTAATSNLGVSFYLN